MIRLQTPAASLLLSITCCALLPSAAQADEGWGPLHFGVGAKTGLNMSVLSPPDVSSDVNPPLPAFVGNGGGVGLAAEVLYGDFVGLEIDLWRVSASGEGSFTFIGNETQVTVGQSLETTETHLPILIKGQVPLRYVKPYVGFGLTLVWQSDARYSVDNPEVTTNIIDPPADSYTMLTTQLGASIDLGKVRIPIELRASWLPLDRDPAQRSRYRFEEREQGLILTDFSVNAAWEAQFWMMVGVQYWDSGSPWR